MIDIRLEMQARRSVTTMKGKPAKIGIQLAAIVVLMIVTTGVAPEANSEDRPKGLASVLIEGASAHARYVVDGSPVSVEYDSESTRPLVLSAFAAPA